MVEKRSPPDTYMYTEYSFRRTKTEKKKGY